MKKILSLIICTFALIIAVQAVANPSCPSANDVRSASLVNMEPAEAPGWYLATAIDGTGNVVVVIYLQAKNYEEAVKTAFNMRNQVAGSWTQRAINVGIDENTNQPVYGCDYRPYQHVSLTGPVVNVPVVAALFEENVVTPQAVKRKLF